MPASAAAVRHAVAGFRASTVRPKPDQEPWAATVARLSTPGQAAEIDADTYHHFRDALPPRWEGEGFMFAEGDEALRYFWTAKGRYFCRQLTWDESVAFAAAAGIASPG